MADIPVEGMTGTASGQIGQGAAFVLDDPKTDDYAMQLAMDERSRIFRDRQVRRQREAELQSRIRANLQKKEIPEMWSAFQKPINNAYNEWLADANAMMMEGKDPLTDPEMLSRWNSEILAPAQYANETFDVLTDLKAKITANPDKYDDQSIEAVFGFEDAIRKDPIGAYRSQLNLPQVSPRAKSADELIDNLTPVKMTVNDGDREVVRPNSAANKSQAYLSIIHNPDDWRGVMRMYGIDDNQVDFGVEGPDGSITFPTSVEYATGFAENMLNDPSQKSYIESIGISENDPGAVRKLATHIREENAKWGNMVDSLGDYLDNKVATSEKKSNLNFQRRMSEENLRIRKDQNARAAANASRESGEDTSNIIIGNAESYVPVVKEGGSIEQERGASVFSANLPSGSGTAITVNPGVVVKLSGDQAGRAEKNSAPFEFKPTGVKLVPVVSEHKNDRFENIELSLRQLDDIINGKSKLDASSISFELRVPGIRTIEEGGEESEQAVEIPYNAVRGNKNFKGIGIEKAYEEFRAIIEHPSFKELSGPERLEFLKQRYNIQ